MIMKTQTKMQQAATLLFSHEGRINRQKYILGKLLIIALVIFTNLPSILSFYFELGSSLDYISSALDVFLLFLFYASIILVIKRCHDRNSSGWHYLFLWVPIVGFIYSFILFFGKGTTGPNRFGEDPL